MYSTDQLRNHFTAVLNDNWQDGFTIPCQGLYPFQWFWDSGFIALGWAHLDMDRAKQEILALLKGQWSNGFIPHIVFHNPSDSYYPGPEVYRADLSEHAPEIPTSGITQPPVTGFVLQDMFRISGNSQELLFFIDSIYDQVFANHQYFYENRDPNMEGLVYICHNWEAGTDNTPVWDLIWDTFSVPEYQLNRKDTKLIDASHRPSDAEYRYYIHLVELFKSWNYQDDLIAEQCPFLIQDPLFNSMLIASNRSLIWLGELLGRDQQVEQLRAWTELAVQGMNDKLYDPDLKGYVYYDLRGERKLPYLSSSSFAPLMAQIPSASQADEMIGHLCGGRFGGKDQENFLCASFDPLSEWFESSRYWRGPVWINLNWIIYKGLRNYQLNTEAEQIKKDTLDLLTKYGCFEYFEPSREMNEGLKAGYGGNNFSWSAALGLDLLNQ
ncbi:MGH1-like glycoside hydrolase domain-containing protein [Aureitalea marina]|uniref:Glycoside hydrolase n=1 Tax=Aureitalea marina TaxID=930804 RepID=A0A2S7KMZ2_9FLAO|nr:trehalase family glycosidase [Aureitalea marina]PQB03994.1 glycoside hydrolase [Aureitalea marina]